MNKTLIRSVVPVVALLVGSAIAFAHNGIEHVMGTITALTESSVTIDTVKHATVVVLLEPSTTFSDNGAAASLKDLKVGDRVVVNAKPNSEKKLAAVSVRWGANSSAHMDHADHPK